MSQQRLLYHAGVVDTAQGSTQQSSNSNATSSSSHPPGEHIEFASSSSSASNAFGGPQWQSNSSTNNYASFNDYTRTTRSERHILPLNEYFQNPSATTPFSTLDSLYDLSNMQQSNAAESSRTAQFDALWAGVDFYPGGDVNSSAPMAGPDSSIGEVFADGLTGVELVQAMFRGTYSVGQVGADFLPNVDGQASTQSSQQFFTPNTNGNVAPPSLQHSGQTSNLESMEVDATEGDSPDEAPADAKQKRAGGF
jgi:hypothetical protein